MTLEKFKLRYPEFAPSGDTWIQDALDQAEHLVADSWGDERDDILGLTAAATMARSPRGRAAQLNSKDGSSVYSRELTERRKRHACCLMRVV